MSIQNEFSSFKLLLKQVYSAHTIKVKELENEVKMLKGKLTEKERENINSLSECKRCIELEEAFKSCKKALHDQSKLFENFGQKFSIFNSPGLENQDLKSIAKSSSCTPEKVKSSRNFKSDVTTCNKNEPSFMSLDESTITDNKINDAVKTSVVSNNQNLLKKVMHDDENLESFDAYTVTFPQHLKQGNSASKFDPLILAPDSLDTTPDTKEVCERKSNSNNSAECKNKKALDCTEPEKLKNKEKHHQENKGTGKRLSSDSLNENRVKRCNTGNQVENSFKLAKTEDIKTSNIISPEIIVTGEIPDVSKQVDVKPAAAMKDLNAHSIHIPKKKNIVSDAIDSKENKNDTPKNLNFLNNVNKSKCTLNVTSPSLLPTNINAPPKIIVLEAISNDNDDFQEQVPSIKSVQNEDSWDACDKKKLVKKNRNAKSVKTTSKYKMTLDAPPLNYKKPTYKQTKLSKSLFQAKDNDSNKKSPERTSISNDVNPVMIDEDSSPLQEHFQTSTPYDATKSPFTIDIDATFIPENFRIESPHCATTNVKKNAVEKSHLKHGSFFSNISFPEELQSAKNEAFNVNENETKDKFPFEEAELKENMNSFDRLPLPEEPNYKYKNDVVRKKLERRQLNGFDCKECEKYYSELGLSDKEKKERMKKCSRHRAKHTPPSTPDHFWELEFPDTQECKARGYMNETQKVKLNNICNL